VSVGLLASAEIAHGAAVLRTVNALRPMLSGRRARLRTARPDAAPRTAPR